MAVVYMRGVSMTDTVFTTDAAIFGEEICWNITSMQCDADAGRFGRPECIPMSRLPPRSAAADADIDWTKVAEMTTDYNLRPKDAAVTRPALQVLVDLKGTLYRIPVDGNHRIVAREKIGLGYFQSYVVPETLERFYRVDMRLVGG